MKLSAILVSVNIAATIPLAVQGAAQAQDGAVSDRAEWLKSNLASIDKSAAPKKIARIGNKKMSLSTVNAVSAPKGPPCISANGVKLQPFVANRKLPSKRDLELELIAQTPRMAAVAPSVLSAQVSESYTAPQQTIWQSQQSGMSNVATYGSTGYFRETSQRVVPSQVVATPGQIRAVTKRRPPQAIRTIAQEEAQIAAQKRPSAQEIERWLDQPQPGERAIGQSGALLVQAPVIAPDEQLQIDKMVEAANPHTFDASPEASGGAGAPSSSSAGPPPFPLNMLPQESLKQLVGGMKHKKTDAPQAYFGSWHGSRQNLPAAGFHSNIRPHSLSSANYGHYAPRNNPVIRTTVNPTPPRNVVVAMKRPATPQVKVASYASYYTQPRIMTY